MTDSGTHWEQLLSYRQQVPGWRQRRLGLAQTRMRVAKLLESAFGFGLDDVEADVPFNGCTADFVLHSGSTPWASVIVRAMADGLEMVPPSEAFVIADAGHLHWCWLTDGDAVHLYHVGSDLALSRVVRCQIADDDEADLRAAWRLLHYQGFERGDLEAYRQARERPDDAAVASALSAPGVMQALHEVLARDFPRPGSIEELAQQVHRLIRPVAGPPALPAVSAAGRPNPEVTAATSPASSGANAEPPVPAKPDPVAPPVTMPVVAHVPAPEAPRRASSLAAILPRRRRSTAWRVKEGGEPVEIPTLGGANASKREATTIGDADAEDEPGPSVPATPFPPAEAPVPLAASADLGAADGPDHHTPVPEAPLASAAPAQRAAPAQVAAPAQPDGSVAPAADGVTQDLPQAAVGPQSGGKASPARRRKGKNANQETLLTVLERQRQAHARLRQNLQDLRENRERLADALAELRQDYPERFKAMAQLFQMPAPPPPAASWSLAGPLHSLGNGSWEAPQTAPVSPWIRRN